MNDSKNNHSYTAGSYLRELQMCSDLLIQRAAWRGRDYEKKWNIIDN